MEMRDVVGWEDLYSVTDDGRVWSKRSSKFLKPARSGSHRGDRFVGLYDAANSRKSQIMVSRLVCEAFHGLKPGDGFQVDHIDGNPDNNNAANLRWLTAEENMQHCFDMGKVPKYPVVGFNEAGDVIRFNSAWEAVKAGFAGVNKVLARKVWVSKGYAFVYARDWPLKIPIGLYFEEMEKWKAVRRAQGLRERCKKRSTAVTGVSVVDGSKIEFPSIHQAVLAGFGGVPYVLDRDNSYSAGYVWYKTDSPRRFQCGWVDGAEAM